MLSPAAASTADAALAALGAAAEKMDRLAEAAASGVAGWWASTVGADSSLSALRSDAKATRTLYETMKRKRPGLATDEEADTFVRVINRNTDTGLAVEVAAGLTPTGALKDVGGATLRDLGDAAQSVGKGWLAVLKAWPYLVLAFLVIVGWSWLGRRHA